MTINESCDFFKNFQKIFNKLKTIKEVGLGYITLGQQSTTLSGGEAQRIKLASELSKKTLEILYIFWMNQRQDFIFKILKCFLK